MRSRWAPLHSESQIPSKPCFLPDRLTLFLLLLAIALGEISCRNPKTAGLKTTNIHSITRELQAAAKTSAPPNTVIRASLEASEENPNTYDHLDITVVQNSSNEATRAVVANLQQVLNAVATRHGLTEEPAESREGILFYYQHASVVTHAVHIHIVLKAAGASDKPLDGSNGARLAIILDDLGTERPAAEQIFSLHYPLTLSVLPNHPHSIEIAEEAHHRGYEVMLHLPMESQGQEKPEAQELRAGMSATEISTLVGQFLQNLPDVVGVNNHQGSQATADLALMSELMPILHERNLFYIDSRTTAATVAFETAQKDGVRSAFRNVPFLDDVAEVSAVCKQLELAIRGARDKGEAIAIGHPHPATLEALRQVLPKAKAQGVHLVFASELTH